MNPSGALTYSYTGGSAVVSPTIATNYSVTGTDANGCKSAIPAVSNVTVNVCAVAAALNFDGVDDEVIIPGINLNNSSFTLETWAKRNSIGTFDIIFGQGNLATNAGLHIGFRNDNSFTFAFFNNDLNTTGTYADNNWHHWAATYDATSNTQKLYLDGTLINTRISTGDYVGTGDLHVGNAAWSGNNFGGNLDEIRVWNIVRTQCEINTYKNCEIPANASGLVANYHFNQGIDGGSNSTVTTLTDASASAYTGTLTNMALTGATSNWIAPGGVTSGSITPANLAITVGATVTNSVVCSGNSTTLSGTGANTYVWTNGVTNGVSFTPTVTATYTVTGTNTVTGCTNSAVNTVTVNSLPVVSVSSGSICAGQSYTIIASGASTYTSVPSLAGPVVTPTATTSYSITGTDANGCVSSNTAVSTVTVNALPTISVNSGAICVGQSFTMIPTGASTYTYSSGTDIVAPIADATYSVSGTDANGCVSSVDAVSSVTVNALPTISVNSGAICAGQSFTMIPSGAATYTYSNGSDVVMPTSDASYTVTGADENGCENNAVSTITVNALPNITASTNNTLLCVGQTATLTANGATSYTWSTTENTTDIVISPTVQTTYTVMGTDVNGCGGETTITQDIDLCTSIGEFADITNEFSVSPNPSNGIFNIHVTTGYNITVLDVLGKVIYSEQLQCGTYTVNLNQYANGLYILKAESNTGSKTIRLVKH